MIKMTRKRKDELAKILENLCLTKPELFIIELADCVVEPVEVVYSIIKEYGLSYCWKFTSN